MALFGKSRLLSSAEWMRAAADMTSQSQYQRSVAAALRARADDSETQRLEDDLDFLASHHDSLARNYERLAGDYRELADSARSREAAHYQATS